MYEWVAVQKYVIFLNSKIAKQFLFKNLNPENEAGRLVADLFSFFRKALYEVKSSGLQLTFNIIQ